jgi:eukaryotic-like serine/threonine-protein kinase
VIAPLSADEWQQLGELFDRLASQPPDQRDLDGLDLPPVMLTILTEMLIAHDSDDPGLLDETVQAMPAHWLKPETADDENRDYTDRRFGPWRALDVIGRGGMSVVLKGERADGRFEKDVAIKVLTGQARRAAPERMQSEIRILARLEHPGIARLIDGGIDDEGLPYLVMEHVAGQNIARFCQLRDLDLPRRLALFAQVVEAVEFAHRQLVVHCDLKPDNILVADQGQVRLVDFGIADLISSDPDQPAALRGWFCSPGYAAPEQLRGQSPSIAQDIFSLGAVLYELLCWQRLRNNQTATRLLLGAASPQPPQPPSKINPDLNRDLDAICLKALAIDPDQRYPSATALLEDLRNFQSRRPVSARGGGRAYRVGRFLIRHQLSSAAAALLILVGASGLVATLYQAEQARVQAEQAQAESLRATATRDFLIDLFAANDPDIAQGRQPTARELLDLGAHQIRTAFVDAPELRAELMILVGNLYRSIGELDAASPLLVDGLDLARLAGSPPLQAEASFRLGQLSMDTGQTDQALAQMGQAEELLQSAGQVPGPVHALLILSKQQVLRQEGQSDQSLRIAQAALQQARLAPHIDPAAMYDYLLAASNAYFFTGQYEQSEPLLREALALEATVVGTPSRRIFALMRLASLLGRQGNFEAAIGYTFEALELTDAIFPAGHARRALVRFDLGALLNQLGRLGEAEAYLLQARGILENLSPDEPHIRMFMVEQYLGSNRHYAGHFEAARSHLERALELRKARSSQRDLGYAFMVANLAGTLIELDELEAAEALLWESIDILEDSLGPDHVHVAARRAVLGQLRLKQQRPAEALALLDQALEIFERAGHEDIVWLLYARGERAIALAQLGRTDQAQAYFEASITIGQNAGVEAALALPLLKGRYARWLNDIAHPEAALITRDALELNRQTFGEEHIATRRLAALMQDTTS